MSAPVVALRWEEPPPAIRSRRRPGDAEHHREVARQLRSQPGRWAVIPVTSSPTGLATHIRSGRLAAYAPAGSFDAVRRLVDGEVRIYARFLGGRDVSGAA